MTPRPPDPASPRPLDRALSLPVLDTAHRIASLDLKGAERSSHLTVALREHTTEADAKTRLKWTISRVWINPPQPATAMIRWAIDHPEHFPDRRLMHTGALMATIPFVGTALAHLGRAFALDQTLTVSDLRRRQVARWGETSTVREAVGKTVTTLRRLRVIEGGGRQPITRCPSQSPTPLVASWLVHAVILSRGTSSLEVREATAAPELFWAGPTTPDPDYTYLERHTESQARQVWTPTSLTS